MAQERSLSDKYYGEHGIHRVPLWRVAGFALNNTATNLYMLLMNYVTYYLTGFVGVTVVTASSFAMMMRIWDGVTDPFIGYVVDKTNGKFGKNRPFMIAGQIILCVMSFLMFHIVPLLPENPTIRYAVFIVMAAVYYVGYTFQCVVTKSAQTCLTNDPKQRPLFTMFDGAFNTLSFAIFGKVFTDIAVANGGFYEQATWDKLWLIVAVVAAIMTIVAVISIAPKDRSEFFGTGKPVKVGLKDYWNTIKGNRAIQMLIVSASSDKLASTMRTSAIYVVLFGLIAGNYSLYGTTQAITTIPTTIICMVFVASLATKLGQRKAMLIGSWGGIILNGLMILLWVFGDPTSMSNADGGLHWGFFTIAYVVLTVAIGGFQGISGNIVIPMTADCADYEVYRTGKYVPGLMGTLFSLVDKLISSFAPMITGMALAAIGFKDRLPDANDTVAGLMETMPGVNFDALLPVGVTLGFGVIILGLLCNVVALKFYPLTKEKMEEIQEEIAAIKAKAAQE